MANKFDWNPIFIRTSIVDKPQQRIDADYWNALWNSTIEQGDNNATGVLLLKTEVETIAEMFAEAMDPTTGIIAEATRQAKLAEGYQVKAEEAAASTAQNTIDAKTYSESIAITAAEVNNARTEFVNVVDVVASARDVAVNAKVAAERALEEAHKFIGEDIVTREDMESYATVEYVNETVGNIKLPEFNTKMLEIPADGWVLEGGLQKLDLVDGDVTADSVVNINLDIASLVVAGDCGLKAVTESYDGGFYIYADEAPAAAMTGTMVFQKGV